ncbi:MAG: Flp pilus assembly complex ATPase component TadA, partial [Ilumatobacter sp.]|nr:Flp pilus assembly complex ATPase component TadA [Ilumatobacter sp.]
DRLVVGEFRGNEALAALRALNTGHDGSLATCHANSALDGLRRLEGLVLQAAPSWPIAAIRRQVTRSIDAVVHVERRDGARYVREVVEPIESDGEADGRLLASAGRVCAVFERGRR